MGITQSITAIPVPGHRGIDTQTIFVNKQEAFQDALVATTVTELNTFATQANAVQADVNTKATNAATSSTAATASANAAASSALAASGSATSASGSATAASASATTASSAATSATASATSATSSATSATGSATSATSSATSATASATAASGSATAAAGSASNASTSAGSASASATAASASATTASTKATEAAGSATSAASSATTATTKATEAATSATAAAASATSIDVSTLKTKNDSSSKDSCVVATTSFLVLPITGLLSIDGITVSAGDRVLVKNQNSPDNGIYIASASTWSRAPDADTSLKLAGAMVTIQKGSNNGGKSFCCMMKSTDNISTVTRPWYNVIFETNTIFSEATPARITCETSTYLHSRDKVFNELDNTLAVLGHNYDLLTRLNWTATTNITASISTPVAFPTTKKYALIVMIGGGAGGDAGIVNELYNKQGGKSGYVQWSIIDLSVMPLATPYKYSTTIGAGGTGGTSTVPLGAEGSTTIFNIFDPGDLVTPLLTYNAIGGYAFGYSGIGAWIHTTSCPVSNIVFYEGNFGTGDNGTTAFAGYGGESTFLGRGGNGGNALATPTAGVAGAANTGAGGGAGALYNTTRTNGGAGGSGKVIIYYAD